MHRSLSASLNANLAVEVTDDQPFNEYYLLHRLHKIRRQLNAFENPPATDARSKFFSRRKSGSRRRQIIFQHFRVRGIFRRGRRGRVFQNLDRL